MGVSDFADLLKPFPLLQMLVAGMVCAAVIFATLRGVKENKRDSHIAPAGHDPHGFAFFANQATNYLSLSAEHSRQIVAALHLLHGEAIKTNARLAELQETHRAEMDHLRDSVEGHHPPAPGQPRARR